MTAPRRRRVAVADDSGTVLVLALTIVTVVSLVVGAVLSYAGTNLRATVAVRGQAAHAATADGAAQAAINTLRLSPYNNQTTSSTYPNCFGNGTAANTADSGRTLLLPDLVPGATGAAANSAAVSCEPDPDTGASGSMVPVTAANKPGNAILTLGTNPSEDGINVKALNSSLPLNVHGGVVSNSNIRVANGTLKSSTYVYARTGCTGNVVGNPVVCNASPVLDPNYPTETATVPAYRKVPANVAANCPGKVMAFQPGYYDDAQALSNLMDGNGACKGSVWWFKPGIYYFDFQNSAGTVPGITGSSEWLIKSGQLIAGTPVDPSGATLAQPPSPATVPGACANPIKSTTAVGVQFIFGGDSRLQMAGSADAEICGTYSATRPPLAFYGLKSGTATPTTVTNGHATAVTATGFAPSPTSIDLPTALRLADGANAAIWTAPAGGGTATLNLSAMSPAPSIPAGSILSSAKLRIVYGASGAASSRSVTVTPSSAAGAGTPVTTTVSPSAATAGTTRTVDLTSSLALPVHDNGLTGLSVGYSTTASAGTVENLDAVLLDLTYTVPTFRGQTDAAVPGNCLAKTYTGGSAGQCAALSSAAAYSGRLYVQGTTYTPAAAIDITLSNVTAQVLRFGVISRTLWVKETGSVSYPGPVIEIPDNSPGYGPGGTVVYLRVYVCEATSTCSTSTGRESLRARVYVYDPSGLPVVGSREMTIQSWAVLR